MKCNQTTAELWNVIVYFSIKMTSNQKFRITKQAQNNEMEAKGNKTWKYRSNFFLWKCLKENIQNHKKNSRNEIESKKEQILEKLSQCFRMEMMIQEIIRISKQIRNQQMKWKGNITWKCQSNALLWKCLRKRE
jgi:hypothetical protein